MPAVTTQDPGTGPQAGGAPDPDVAASAARATWLATMGVHAERDRPVAAVHLPPPASVVAIRGRGQVTVDWAPVRGAAGYIVHRGPTVDGPFEPIDHGGGDLLAVPGGPYLDTQGSANGEAWYAVSSVATIEAGGGGLSVPVAPARGPTDAAVTIDVDAAHVTGMLARPWRPIIGSEHLALLLQGSGPGGRPVGEELAESFRIVHRELGVEAVRAHGIFDDALAVYRDGGDGPIHDFAQVDAMLDRLLETGLRPIIELGFTPRDLATDPTATVFGYEANVSPPRDLARWAALVRDLTEHLADRYGRPEVRRWAFEVWNEPNLRVFWSGTESDYFRLYDASVAAVRSVDPGFRVGGPATAAAGWVDDLLDHCRTTIVPLDFLSTHTYGVAPLDLRPVVARFGRPDLPLWWTEWGISPRHGAPVNDGVWGAPLVARGMRSAAGRVAAVAYWVASDHFVELGEAPSLFHGGFGLLTIGNLRKPRFWAIAMLERLGRDELAVRLDGDGSGSLVEAWASSDPDGRVAIAAWNGTLDQSGAAGDRALDRSVTLAVEGVPPGDYDVRHHRVDARHSNIARTWARLGRPVWPDEAGWARLRAADHLEMLGPPRRLTTDGRRLQLEFDLPMPSMSLVELVPVGTGNGRGAGD